MITEEALKILEQAEKAYQEDTQVERQRAQKERDRIWQKWLDATKPVRERRRKDS